MIKKTPKPFSCKILIIRVDPEESCELRGVHQIFFQFDEKQKQKHPLANPKFPLGRLLLISFARKRTAVAPETSEIDKSKKAKKKQKNKTDTTVSSSHDYYLVFYRAAMKAMAAAPRMGTAVTMGAALAVLVRVAAELAAPATLLEMAATALVAEAWTAEALLLKLAATEESEAAAGPVAVAAAAVAEV